MTSLGQQVRAHNKQLHTLIGEKAVRGKSCSLNQHGSGVTKVDLCPVSEFDELNGLYNVDISNARLVLHLGLT